jgi:ribosomal-protein-alanine N-acetyltransferase
MIPYLESDRLALRRLELTDAPMIYAYMREREIAYNTLYIPYPYPPGAAEEWINRRQETWGTDEGFTFALARKPDDLFMGSIAIRPELTHQRAEIGYWLGKPHWGQGYMSEAARRVIQYGFEEHNLNRVHATYFSRNPASRRVMEKAGMTYEGMLRQHVVKWDEYIDLGVCGIVREDWEKGA